MWNSPAFEGLGGGWGVVLVVAAGQSASACQAFLSGMRKVKQVIRPCNVAQEIQRGMGLGVGHQRSGWENEFLGEICGSVEVRGLYGQD